MPDFQMCNLRLKYPHALFIKCVIIETHNIESFHSQLNRSVMKRVSWSNKFSHVQFDVKISAFFSLEMYACINDTHKILIYFIDNGMNRQCDQL